MSGRRVHQVRRDLLLAAVREAGRSSRSDLARRTGMARMTVDHLVAELLTAGLLAEEAAVPDGTRAGRPARSIVLGPAAGGVVGAIVTSHGVRVASADLTGRILAEHHGTGTDLDALALLVAECGTGVSGPAWSVVLGLGTDRDHTLATGLQQRLGRRVIVRTAAELSLLGEVGYGAASGHTDVCYLRVGAGITCGLLLGGVLHHGAHAAAGRFGHVQMDEIGSLCRCGNRGCLDTIASVPAILAALGTPHGEPVTATRAVELSRTDAATERILADAGRMIGRVVADLANTVNPALVLLDGPLIEPGGPIITAVGESLQRYAQPEVAAGTEVRAGTLGDRAALLGALFAGLRATPAARGSRTLARVSPTVTTADLAPSGRVASPGARERVVRREILVESLRTLGQATRSDLVKHTRLPRAAVAALLDALTRDGVVEPCAATGPRAGRPSPCFRLVAPGELLVGVAIGGDGVRVIATDGAGEIRWSGFRSMPPASDGRAIMRDAAGFVRELLDGNGERPGPGTRFGVSMPAPVHPHTGYLSSRSVLTMFAGFSPAEEIAAVLGHPVRVTNNAQLAALAESRRGAARGARDVLYLSCDQYCGAGLLAGGRMHSGAIGYAGEVGHLNVREVGPLCLCGKRGCLSAFLSPGHFAAISDGGPPDEDRLLARAAAGDRPAQRALLDAGRLIGRTVTSLVSVFDPAVVVVGGRFAEPGGFVVDGVRESLQRHCAPAVAAALTVVPAALGRNAEALGAIESLR
ncbi:ROK family transcriptional regulator [Actinoplanes subglobosus]|uniref:ROK family protein n=1 Tax=Actinoplanes subglobosus TaxID=1547892 RepID=A0ABV8IJI1_9ACTN